ncbi:MAG: ATP-dependent sacrificial sulfur transferase LarE [Phycisphaerales bacterium]|nr:ATP-dependent sacrificial sulfur transferase LarE [Phycisphaerales bacterium]
MLRSLERVVVAFSGGVDSTLVLKAAVEVLGRENVLAVTSRSASVAAADVEDAVRLAEQMGAAHEFIETDEFTNPDYLANPTNRCYHCKTSLYSHLERIRIERGMRFIVNGTNADDETDYRPGLLAAAEHGVRAPAAEAGMTKSDIRVWSARMGLPTHDKPASPCLSSRVQYGEAITPEKLRRIEACEAYLRGLGFRECRVRHHGDLARIEVAAAEVERLMAPALRSGVDGHFREAGYAYVTVDLRGFRSGSMNEGMVMIGTKGRRDEGTKRAAGAG